jgi:hypothetical protein
MLVWLLKNITMLVVAIKSKEPNVHLNMFDAKPGSFILSIDVLWLNFFLHLA